METIADFELAWTNLDRPAKEMVAERNEDGKREHPTQKPLRIMKWALQFVRGARVIADPFMGSGTTGVAAVQLGLDFIGIEIEPKYFDIAVKRIKAALAQPSLFEKEKRREKPQSRLPG